MVGRAVRLAMLLVFIASTAFGNRITVLTYEWRPFNFEEDGQIKGISTDVVRETLRRAGIEAEFRMCPWARAYRWAMEEENVMLFTIARTPEREEHFQFICPVAPPVKNVFFKLPDRQEIHIGSLDDARSYRIGVQDRDVLHQLLLRAGFEENKTLFPVPDNEQNLKKLLSRRIDLMAGHDLPTFERLKSLGWSRDRLQVVYTFDSFEECAAFGRKTADELVERIRRELQAVREEGLIDHYTGRYLSQ